MGSTDGAGRKPSHPNGGATEAGSSQRTVWLALAGLLVVGVVFIAGALVTGLGTQDPATGSSESDTAASPSTADGRFPIVAYQGTDEIGAEELDFTEVLGTGLPVVLNFWAGQCPPCRAEMPAFQRVYETYGSDFLLLGVDVGPFLGLGSRQSAVDLLAELDITYPAAYALDDRAVREYGVLGMPTTIFYDGDGVEVDRQIGILTEDALEAEVRELVGLS